MALPANIPTGRVSGGFVTVLPAGVRGRIDFTPTVGSVAFPDALPDPLILLQSEPIPAVLNDKMQICTPNPADPTKAGERGINLPATDAAGASVTGWQWRGTPVLINEKGVRVYRDLKPFIFSLPTQGPDDPPLDLARIMQNPVVPGSVVAPVADDSARSAAAAARDAQQARTSASAAQGEARNAAASAEVAVASAERSAVSAVNAEAAASSATTRASAAAESAVRAAGTSDAAAVAAELAADSAGVAEAAARDAEVEARNAASSAVDAARAAGLSAAGATSASQSAAAAEASSTTAASVAAAAKEAADDVTARADSGEFDGADGANGTTPTIGVGTVATGAAGSAAAVTVGGTATARTFNFTIPQGAKGADGAPGLRLLGTVPTVGDLPTGAASAPTAAAKTFTALTTSIPNPERGWFQYSETHWENAAGSTGLNTPLVQSDLVAARTGTTAINGANFSHSSIVFRYYVMEYMRGVDTLPAAFLTMLAADFATARAAGVKLVIRFAYSTNGETGSNADTAGPYGTDTTVARTLSHVAQLKATVDAGSDVVHAVQAGFIGTWGEWYYTDNWGNKGTLTAQNWTDRAALITALLGWDSKINILLRYPGLKHRYMQGTGLPANAATRLGFHNDAFLADAAGEDWGTFNTFSNGQTVAQLKSYMTAEAQRPILVMGETAGVSTRSTAANAVVELAAYDWSSLNPRYHPDVLASWTQAQKDDIGQKLGYRLRLASATLPTAGPASASAPVTLSIVNDGYAAPVVDRPIQIVFTQSGQTSVVRTLARKARSLAPGTSTFTETIALPSGAGTWAVNLSMPDPNFPSRAEYAIRLANTTTYSGVLNNLAANVTVFAAAAVSAGDAYTVDATGHIFTWSGTSWIDGGMFRGPAGPPGSAPVANTPFTVRFVNNAWEFASLADAVAAGLNTAQTIWFIGGTAAPAWRRPGDVFTQL